VYTSPSMAGPSVSTNVVMRLAISLNVDAMVLISVAADMGALCLGQSVAHYCNGR